MPNNILPINFLAPHQEYELYYQSFQQSRLGQLYQVIPWKGLTHHFSKKASKSQQLRGRKSIFTTQGKLALMFLKAYTNYSDRKLMERLSTDYSFQFFCGVYFKPGDRVPGFKLISDIRSELASKLDIISVQSILARAWGNYLTDTNVLLTDATAYESYMRYPTEVKLLWECCEWLYGQMKKTCKVAALPMPRNKYSDQKSKYLSYQKNRKKTYKHKRKRIKSLLYLLEKLTGQLDTVVDSLPEVVQLPASYHKRRALIDQVYEQQTYQYQTGEHPPNKIVSIDKGYIRPIVRGKEIKRVEFGAKVNMIQVGGINFIEHLSFDAFHEGVRLPACVKLHEQLFGPCTHLSADRIYASNANRSYCKDQQITTNFLRKGRAAKDEKQRNLIRKILSRQRATQTEGSFGTEKNHYSLSKIKARTKLTEMAWIFFGVHTANAVRMIPKITPDTVPEKAA